MSFDKLPCSPARCVELLKHHNAWRRGDESLEMLHPAEISVVIDVAVELIEQRNKLLAALTGLVEEKQPLGIDRAAYQNAIGLIVSIEDDAA